MLLLALALSSSVSPASKNYKVGQCFKDQGEFESRIIRIVEVGKTEYRYEYKFRGLWVGVLSNDKETIETIYINQVKCT